MTPGHALGFGLGIGLSMGFVLGALYMAGMQLWLGRRR